MAAIVAVLHATISIFAPSATSPSAIANVRATISSAGRPPYGQWAWSAT